MNVSILYSKRHPDKDVIMIGSTKPFKGAGVLFLTNEGDLSQAELRKIWFDNASEEDRRLYLDHN